MARAVELNNFGSGRPRVEFSEGFEEKVVFTNEYVLGTVHQRARNAFSIQSRKNRLDVAPLEMFMRREEKMEIRHLVHASAMLPERFEFLCVSVNKRRTDETSRSRKERRREH